VAWSPDGTRIVSGSDDKTVKVWDPEKRQEVRTLTGHMSRVTSVAWSPDGTRIVSGSDDKTVKVWDSATGQEVLSLEGHTGSVYSVAWSPDGKRIVSGSYDYTLKVWDLSTRAHRVVGEHVPDSRVLSVWRDVRTAVFAAPDKVVTFDDEQQYGMDWIVALVREADGMLTLGAKFRTKLLEWQLSSSDDHRFWRISSWPCRAFLLEPEVVAKLETVLGDRPWTDAFLPEVIAGKFEVAQILAAVPEMEGKMRPGHEIVFDRLRVSERYDTLPPRSAPLQGVIVLAPRPSDDMAAGEAAGLCGGANPAS
jgi:hypothetical protein